MKKKILIVDSNIDNIKLYGKFLTTQLFDVLVATSTKQAILIAEAKSPDTILTTSITPQINGLTIYKTLKKKKKTSNIPFLFIAEKKDKPPIEKINKTKEYNLLLKPFSTAELLIKINTLLKTPDNKNNFTIMVVDDIEINRNLVEDFLVDQPFKILKSSGGKDSIKKINQNKIDLILLDIEMPVMDGWETINSYKKDLKIKIPVIALTAHANKDVETKCIAHGFKGVITKPINRTKLKNTIEKIFLITSPKSKQKPLTKTIKNLNKNKKSHYINISHLMQVTKDNRGLKTSTYNRFYKNINELQKYFLEKKRPSLNSNAFRRELHSFINLVPYFCEKEIIKKAKKFEQQLKNTSNNIPLISNNFALFLSALKEQLERAKIN